MSQSEPVAQQQQPVSTQSKSAFSKPISVTARFSQLLHHLRTNEKAHIAWCVIGIVGCLLLYGALQVRFCSGEPSSELALLAAWHIGSFGRNLYTVTACSEHVRHTLLHRNCWFDNCWSVRFATNTCHIANGAASAGLSCAGSEAL
jgi:hypothetical protein